MSHDNYDDGLVHSHGWAHGWTHEAPTTFATARRRGALVAAAMGAHPEEPGFDDGLVHGHGWASAETAGQGRR
jgi:hypothetical protein